MTWAPYLRWAASSDQMRHCQHQLVDLTLIRIPDRMSTDRPDLPTAITGPRGRLGSVVVEAGPRGGRAHARWSRTTSPSPPATPPRRRRVRASGTACGYRGATRDPLVAGQHRRCARQEGRAGRFRIYLQLDTAGQGWLTKRGALPQHLLRKWICDGIVQPVWETQGAPVNVGRAQRIVPDCTRRLVEDRDRGCARTTATAITHPRRRITCTRTPSAQRTPRMPATARSTRPTHHNDPKCLDGSDRLTTSSTWTWVRFHRRSHHSAAHADSGDDRSG